MPPLTALLQSALSARVPLFARLAAEETDCYRLFHGSNEGVPGLTVDRYGSQLLIQSFHSTLPACDQETIVTVSQTHFSPLEVVYNDRSSAHSRRHDAHVTTSAPALCREMGLNYRIQGKHAGQDPLLFLDLRAGRRFVRAQAAGLEVLNLCAYTCGLGLAAVRGGAREVWNLDFAARNLAIGRENAELNGMSPSAQHFFQSDLFPAIRQWADLPVGFRQRRAHPTRNYPKLSPRQFDLVCLDPPRWSKSPFGTIDLIRDYQSLFKPSLLITRPGGRLFCTHNVAATARSQWAEDLHRCARKAGREIHDLQWLEPETDFPSRDGQHPLKMAVIQV